MTVVWLREPCRFERVLGSANGDWLTEKTISAQNVAPRNPLKLNGSLLFVTVFGGAGCNAFPVTPAKTPVSFRFDAKPNKTKA
jgi:hypothetical protein